MEKLTDEERKALKKAGIEVVTYYSVVQKDKAGNVIGFPYAMFLKRGDAEHYKHQKVPFAHIEEFHMQVSR